MTFSNTDKSIDLFLVVNISFPDELYISMYSKLSISIYKLSDVGFG